MKQQLLAWKTLLARYGQIGRAAWRNRRDMDPPKRLAHELAFLPAHLELQDTPISAAPKWTLRLLLLLCALTVLWAAIGQLDIVAVAPGRVVPSERVKVVQPLEPGIVRKIHVSDGQVVAAGQLLIELDATSSTADLAKSEEANGSARLAQARARALQVALEQNQAPVMSDIAGVTLERMAIERQLMQTQWAEFHSKRATQQAELSRRTAELATTRQQVEKLEKTLPFITQRADDYLALLGKNFVSRHGYLEIEKERVAMEQDLAVQRGRVQELIAAIAAQQQLLQNLSAEFSRQQSDQIQQAQQQASQTGEERAKALQRQQLTALRAPVAGTVQQLATHTIGGVVTSAQPLMVIVPENTLEIEATVENKDIGFVQTGQRATVKIEAFPYTRYGYLTGTVQYLSLDALNDEKKGLVYRAHIRLPQDRLLVDQQWVRLTPGMAVSAEIKTGKRRVLEYFLSPVIEHIEEGLRER